MKKDNSFWTDFRERQEKRAKRFGEEFERKKEKMDREYERDCNEAMKAVSGMMDEFSASGVLMNAVSMVVEDISWKEQPTENERYLLEVWMEYCKRKGSYKG